MVQLTQQESESPDARPKPAPDGDQRRPVAVRERGSAATSGPTSESGCIASVPLARAERIAHTGCSVLLTGETGTGKGYLAAWLHERSQRADRTLVPVNCGAIPESVIDSHLFGHVRGAFSDAHRDHPGLVGAAEGGTLFLDEVADLPMSAQLRLLRLLEEREAQPVGALRPRIVDVRIIAATNRDLYRMVEEGTFRPDLYYRLDVIHLALRPLRERRHEIPALIDVLAKSCATQLGVEPLEFTGDAVAALVDHPWPGNVRQVRTVLERLHVFVSDRIVTAEDLSTWGQLDPIEGVDLGVRGGIRPPAAAGAIGRHGDMGRRANDERSAGRSAGHRSHARPAAAAPARPGHGAFRNGYDPDRLRYEAAVQTVADCGGNVSAAATRLGVHRSTVHRWLQRARATA